MNSFRAHLLIVAILLVLAVGTVWWRSHRPTGPSTPDFVTQASPTEVRAAVVAGGARVTVINFWAQWCEPCKREFSHFLRLHREWAERGVKVLFVSVDDRADLPEVEAFLRSEGVDFPTFYKGRQSLNFVEEIFPKWSGAIPATLLLGPNAEPIEAWEGDTSWKELETKISAALKKPSSASRVD